VSFDYQRNLYVDGTGAEEVSLLFGHAGWPAETYRGITYRLPTYGGSEAGFLRYHAAGHKFTSEDGTELMRLNYISGYPGAWFPGDVSVDSSLGVNGDITTIYDVGGLRISGSNFGGSGATLNLASDNFGDANRYDVTFARSGTKTLEYDYSNLHWNFQGVKVVNTGYLGVNGITNPNKPLHVKGVGTYTGGWDTSGGAGLNAYAAIFENGTGNNTTLALKCDANQGAFIDVGDTEWRFYMGWKGTSAATDAGMFSLNFGAGGFLLFDNSWNEVLKILDGGYVGINTNTPENYLHVVGSGGKISGTRPTLTNVLAVFEGSDSINTNIGLVIGAGGARSGNIQAFRAGSTTAFGVMRFEESSGDFVVRLGDGLGTITDKLRITNAGNVGIGTSSPPDRLLVVQRGAGVTVTSASTYLQQLLSDSDAVLQFGTPNTAAAYIRFSDPDSFGIGSIKYDHASDYMSFTTGGSERMRVNANGKVSINQAAPQDGEYLSVYGGTTQTPTAWIGNGTGLTGLGSAGAQLHVYSANSYSPLAAIFKRNASAASGADIVQIHNDTVASCIIKTDGLWLTGSTSHNRLVQRSNNGAYYNWIYSNLSDSVNYGMILGLQGTSTHWFMPGGSYAMLERATAYGSTAGWGQMWTKNDAPNVLMFTDDTGFSTQVSMSSGTFTPVLADASNSAAEGQTFSVQTGQYWRIGDLCFIKIDLEISSLGSLTTTDQARIINLPFTASTDNNNCIPASYGNSLNITAGSSVHGRVQGGSGRLLIEQWNATTGTGAVSIAQWSLSGRVIFSGWYTVA